jgi:hypothetical protein
LLMYIVNRSVRGHMWSRQDSSWTRPLSCPHLAQGILWGRAENQRLASDGSWCIVFWLSPY